MNDKTSGHFVLTNTGSVLRAGPFVEIVTQPNGDHVAQVAPIPMRLPCPSCHALHIDEGEFATKAHHTHACQECGQVWRPATVPTIGVQFLPGFKNP